MTLDRLIGRIALIGGVALSSYTCDSTDSPSCIKDTDCKGERICVQGVCQPQGSYGGDASNTSPLCNNYVELINYCCKAEGPRWSDECKKSQSLIIQNCESLSKDPYGKKELDSMIQKYNSNKSCKF